MKKFITLIAIALICGATTSCGPPEKPAEDPVVVDPIATDSVKPVNTTVAKPDSSKKDSAVMKK